MTEKPTAEALAACGFFEGLPLGELEGVAAIGHEERFEAGQQIFAQGAAGDRLYVVCDGRVCLERTTDLGARRGKVTLALLEQGNAFGAWTELLGEPHGLMTTALCLRPTTVVSLDVTELRAMMVANPAFGFALMERLCLLLRDRLTTMLGALEKLST